MTHSARMRHNRGSPECIIGKRSPHCYTHYCQTVNFFFCLSLYGFRSCCYEIKLVTYELRAVSRSMTAQPLLDMDLCDAMLSEKAMPTTLKRPFPAHVLRVGHNER